MQSSLKHFFSEAGWFFRSVSRMGLYAGFCGVWACSCAAASGEDLALFRGIGTCDPLSVEAALESGANARGDYPLELNEEFNISISADDEVPPLAFAMFYWGCLQKYQDRAQETRMRLTAQDVSRMARALVGSGADPDQVVDVGFTRYDEHVPISHIPFHVDVPEVFAVQYFELLVALGADPNSRDERGNTVLNSFSRFSLEQYEKLYALGVSYNTPRADGATHASHFPPSLSYTKDFARIIDVARDQYIDFSQGEFGRPIWHPVVREFTRFSSNDLLTLDDRNGRFKVFREDFLDLTALILNTPAGAPLRHPLVHMMIDTCPTAKPGDLLTFPFEDRFGRPLSSKRVQELAEAYGWLKELAEDTRFDVGFVDDSGLSLLGYAMHLCPLELVQVIADRASPLSLEDLRAFENLSPDTVKAFGALKPLNNDPRTFDWLISIGVSRESLSTALYDVSDTPIRQKIDASARAWRSLASVGFDYFDTLKVRTDIEYGFDYYLDIKETVYELPDPSPVRTHSYSGVPVGRLIGPGRFATTFRGLGYQREDKAFTFSVSDGRLDYQVSGAFSYDDDLSLAEIAPSGTPLALTIEETNSPKTERRRERRSEEIVLSATKPYLLDHSFAYQLRPRVTNYRATGQFWCAALVCAFLRADLTGAPQLSVDAAGLSQAYPHIGQLWDYLNTSLENRKPKRQAMRAARDPDVLAYLPDLIQTRFDDLRHEDESLDFLDMLADLEFRAELPFPIAPVIEKISQLEPLSDTGYAFQALRLYLLTGQDRQIAYDWVTSDFLRIQEFVLLRSDGLKDTYDQRHAALLSDIKANTAAIAANLNLDSNQIKLLEALW